MPPDPAAIREARNRVRNADRIVVLTGAGISSESGVPTFRGPDGLWRSHRPEDLATPEAFERDPGLVWSWYRWRRDIVGRCAPNPGHLALAELALERPGVRLVTQNVDGLHERAAMERAGNGSPDAALAAELHGSLWRDRCSSCGRTTPALPEPITGAYGETTAGPSDADVVDAEDTSKPELPSCPTCGGLLRPDVVWFGEALDGALLESAFEAAVSSDLCIVVGTSALVHPAASIPLATLQSGGAVVEVNPESTPLTRHAAVSLAGASATLLPEILGPRPSTES